MNVVLNGTANTNPGANVLYGIQFAGLTRASNNEYDGLYFANGAYDNVLNVAGTSIIKGNGLIQNAGFDSTLNYSNLQQLTNLTASGNLNIQGTTQVALSTGGTTPVCVNASNILSTCPSGTGVSSLDSLSGALSLANSTGSGSTVTINDAAADGVTKGIATFSATNFSATTGLISIKAGGVTTAEILDGTVTGTDIASGTITGANIASTTVDNTNLVNSALTVTAGTGLTGGGSISLGGSGSLSVTYGSTTGTAVQGSTTLLCPVGNGNLSGGGNSITLGTGGTCNAIDITTSPVFAGTLTVQGSGGLSVGTTSVAGLIKLSDGSSHTATINLGAALTGNQTYSLPTTGGTICVLEAGNCTGTGSGVTTVGALDNGMANATGATINTTTLYLQSASGSYAGLVNTAAQTFAGDKTFSGNVAINGGNLTSSASTVNLFNITPTTINFAGNATTIKIGAATGNTTINNFTTIGQSLDVKGSTSVNGTISTKIGLELGTANSSTGNITFRNSANSYGVTISSASQPANLTLSIPTDSNSTDTICLQVLANCSSSGGSSGGISGTGATNAVARFTGTNSVGTGILYDDGTAAGAGISSQLNSSTFGVAAAASSIALSAKGASGQDILNLLNNSSSVVAGFNASGNLYQTNSGFKGTLSQGTLTANRTYTLPDMSGIICVDGGNCAVSSGSGNYIQNQTIAAQTANFFIQGASSTVTAIIQGASGQDIADFKASGGGIVASISQSGLITGVGLAAGSGSITGSGGVNVSGGLALTSGAISLTANATSTITTSSGALTVQSAGIATFGTINVTGLGVASSNVILGSGSTNSTGTAISGSVTISTGATGGAVTGAINLQTGIAGSSGVSGAISIATGNGLNASGSININTGNTTGANPGSVNLNTSVNSNGNVIVGNGSNAFTVNATSTFNKAITLIGGLAPDITTAAGTAPTNITIQPGNNTSASSTGAGITIQGGSDSGTTSSTGGTLTLQGGNATGSGTKVRGGVTIDAGTGTSGGVVSIGTANAGSIALGYSGITTTITGGLTQQTGAFSLTGNAASSITTTAGSLTIQGTGNTVFGSTSSSGATSDVTLSSGAVAISGGTSGNLMLMTGNTIGGAGGTVSITGGNSAGSHGGNITIETGTSASGSTSITIGSLYTSTINIGKSAATLNLKSNTTVAAGSTLSLAAGTGTIGLAGYSGTGSAVSVVATASPTSGNALLFANNTASTPTGNLLELKAGTDQFTVDASGNVVVAGTETITGVTCIGTTGCTNKLGVSGSIGASGSITANTTPDLAEYIPAASDVAAADVVMADPNNAERVIKAAGAYSGAALGVISDGTSSFKINPYGNVTGAAVRNDIQPLVLAGRVPVKISGENGPVVPGDYLTTSSTPGYAMKAVKAGATIGKALGFFDGNTAANQGTVLVLVNVSYYDPGTTGGSLQGASLSISGNADFGGNVSVGGNLNVIGAASVGSLHVSANATFAGDVTVAGTLRVADIVVGGHIITSGAAPTGALNAAYAAGVNLAIDGNDTTGTVTITTSDSQPLFNDPNWPTTVDTTNGVSLLNLKFNKQFGGKARVLLSPSNASAARLGAFTSDESTDGFQIATNSMLGAGKSYTFTYWVAQ